jgi:hypothetical protein
MSFGFLNAIMLAGLAAAALPVLVHLISKRKYDVVEWGAMQFLELGRRTRRRIRLEELLLLLLRMGLIALVAMALARPWAKGGLFSSLSDANRRDVAIVLDGSYSMGWEEKVRTPYAAGIQWAHKLLETLHGGDTVMLLDARDQVRTLVDRPTGDFSYVRQQLDDLPGPSGTSHLVQAATKAARLLTEGENLDRDIVLIGDHQALAWTPEDAIAWRQFDDLVSQSTITPRVWAVDVADRQTTDPVNFSVDRLSLSRELTVPGFPMRFETTIRQSGGTSTRRDVHFSVNGQRLQEKTIKVSLPANGQAAIAFEHRFSDTGSYVVSVSLDGDHLPGDNRSDAAVVVSDGIPVLLVDGNPQRDRSKSAAFFAHAALTPSRSISPWVRASVVGVHEFSAESLAGPRVAFLTDVARLNEAQLAALREFVADGGGLIVAPGAAALPDFYNTLAEGDDPLLPATLVSQQQEKQDGLGPMNILSDSLDVSWLTRFRRENAVDLIDARFARWWQLQPRPSLQEGDTDASTPGPPRTRGASDIPPDVGNPQVVARLDSNEPFLVTQTYGKGSVMQLAVPLNADWGTLPAKNDFVPLLHEMVFYLASRTSGRNVAVGTPLLMDLPQGATVDEYQFVGPDGKSHPAEPAGDAERPRIRLSRTDLPGTYRAEPKQARRGAADYFVVNFDRRESDLTPLTPPEQTQLATGERIRFIDSLDDMQAALLQETAPSELWRWMLLIVLAILVGEVLLTRRLVQGGHESTDDEAAAEPAAAA